MVTFNNSETTFQKVRLLEDIKHTADYNLMLEIVSKWKKKSNDNADLNELSDCLFNTFLYVHKLQEWRDMSETAFTQYRNDKNRAIQRARKLEKQVEELELEIKRLKLITNL